MKFSLFFCFINTFTPKPIVTSQKSVRFVGLIQVIMHGKSHHYCVLINDQNSLSLLDLSTQSHLIW